MGVLRYSGEDFRGLLGSSGLKPDQLVDKLAMVEQGASLVELAEGTWTESGPDRKVEVWDRGVVLKEGDSGVAVVCPTHALRSGGGKRIKGRFTRSGPHWRRLWVRLGLEKEPSRKVRKPKRPAPAPRTSKLVLLNDLSSRVSPELHKAAVEASDRIKHERSLVVQYPAKLEADELTLTLHPVASEGRALRVPFEYSDGKSAVSGVLYLKSPERPIAAGIAFGPEEARGKAVAYGLLGFADLTCPVSHPGTRPGQRLTSGLPGQRPRPGADGPTKPRKAPPRKARPSLGRPLRPDAASRDFLSSIVIGHKRKLGTERSPSEAARKRAEMLGIMLGPGETWVMPHTRGQDSLNELRFSWEPSES